MSKTNWIVVFQPMGSTYMEAAAMRVIDSWQGSARTKEAYASLNGRRDGYLEEHGKGTISLFQADVGDCGHSLLPADLNYE